MRPIASLTPRRLRRASLAAVTTLTLAGALGLAPASAGAAAASSWVSVPVPQSTPFAEMSGASLVNATSGWGVGVEGQNEDFNEPAIWRWTVAGWQQQDVSALPSPSELDGVSADQGHAWIIGMDYSQPGAGTGLNLYWDGSSWTRAASTASLFTVVATGATAWAAGLAGTYPDQVPAVFRWNGTNWVVARRPANLSELSIAATSATDVWVAGTNDNGKAVVLHDNGTSWTRMSPLGLGGAHAIAASSPDNVWVAGESQVAHYNGTSWTKFKLPWTGQYGPGALAVDASGAPWLTVTTSLVANRSQYFRLAGTKWVQELGPVRAQAIGMNTTSLTPVPGTCALLASGWATVFNQPIVALTEVQPDTACPSPAAASGPAAGRLAGAVTAAARAPTARPASSAPATAAAPQAGPAWTVTPAPPAEQPLSTLSDVAAAGPKTAWAVGQDLKGTLAPGDPLILRWNGTAWHKAALPGVTWSGSLTAVSAASAQDAWAAGQENPNAAGLPRLLHWNGTRWAEVAFPGDTSSGTSLSAVAAISPSDAWFAGTGPDGAPVMLHWDGSAVQPVTLPVTSGAIHSVRALSADDVWAVGFSGEQALTLHWDGSTWQELPAPTVASASSAQFSDVLPAADGTAYAVGLSTSGGFVPSPLLEHWDGSAWTQVTLPSFGPGALNSISGDAQGNPEWIGTYLLSATTATTVYLHGNGTSWDVVDGPAVPSEDGGDMRVAHVPGTSVTLAAGSASLSGNYDQTYPVPLLESYP